MGKVEVSDDIGHEGAATAPVRSETKSSEKTRLALQVNTE